MKRRLFSGLALMLVIVLLLTLAS